MGAILACAADAASPSPNTPHFLVSSATYAPIFVKTYLRPLAAIGELGYTAPRLGDFGARPDGRVIEINRPKQVACDLRVAPAMPTSKFLGRAPGRLLVADDDQEMRRVLADTFRREGYEVHEVSDGAALLIELARNHRFHYDTVDVVVADVRMPLCSGLQALETIRALRPHLPFVLLTAFGDHEMHARAASLGAELLDKPVSMKRVSGAVASAIQKRAATS